MSTDPTRPVSAAPTARTTVPAHEAAITWSGAVRCGPCEIHTRPMSAIEAAAFKRGHDRSIARFVEIDDLHAAMKES